MKKTAFIFLFFLACNSFAQSNYKLWLNGSWTGTCFHPVTGKTWQADLNFSGPNGKVLVNYPSLKCGGELIMISETADKVTFKEKITDGKGHCLDGMKLIVTKIDNEYINVSWFSNYTKGLNAFAALKRDLSWLIGQWKGTGYQTNNSHTWAVEFSYDTKNKKATINYPSLNCRGEWIFESFDGNRTVFKEVINIGKKNCIDGSKIIVSKIDEYYISIAWFSKYMEGIDAYSVLQKQY